MIQKPLADVEAMQDFAAVLAPGLDHVRSIYLQGDLGAGKTTLVRALLTSLGHIGSVKSPTFTLIEPYTINDRQIYHFDLYRMDDEEELEAIGARDYFTDDNLCLVEWPENAKNLLPTPDLLIKIDYCESGRSIELIPQTENGQTFLSKVNLETD